MKLPILLALLLAACTKIEPDVNDPTHEATWTTTVTCGTKVAHPCPYMTFTTLATFYTTTTGALAITWWDAGAVDIGPDQELTSLDADGNILLPERGDNAGERLASTLTVSPDGYAGDVKWLLYNIAGMTTFHLVIDRPVAEMAAISSYRGGRFTYAYPDWDVGALPIDQEIAP